MAESFAGDSGGGRYAGVVFTVGCLECSDGLRGRLKTLNRRLVRVTWFRNAFGYGGKVCRGFSFFFVGKAHATSAIAARA